MQPLVGALANLPTADFGNGARESDVALYAEEDGRRVTIQAHTLLGRLDRQAAVQFAWDPRHEVPGIRPGRQWLGYAPSARPHVLNHIAHQGLDSGQSGPAVRRQVREAGNSAQVATCSPSSSDHVMR